VGNGLLHEVVFRQRDELWVKIGYMKLCLDRDLNCGESWLLEAVCRQRDELCVTIGYMKLCVDREHNCE
jgi:hypothetical protein